MGSNQHSVAADGTAESQRADPDKWLDWFVDQVASEYGWSRSDILDKLYPYEIDGINRAIEKRRIEQRLDAIYDSAIPNMDESNRRNAVEQLLNRLRAIEGLPEVPPELDRSGLSRLKNRIANSGNSTIKVSTVQVLE